MLEGRREGGKSSALEEEEVEGEEEALLLGLGAWEAIVVAEGGKDDCD